MKISENGVHRELIPEEEAKWIADTTKAEREEKTRPLTDSEVFRLFTAQSINTLSVDDNTSLRMISYYPTWEELCTKSYKAEKAGYKFQYGGKLYKTIPPEHTFQSQWVPGQGTGSIYTQIVEGPEGSETDPIPVPSNVPPDSFTYTVGKVYSEDGVLWKCQREGDEPGKEYSFAFKPSQVPGYFIRVE